MRIKLPNGFEPRHYQTSSNRAHFVDGKRFLIDVLHRRAGKTFNALNFLVMRAFYRVGAHYHTFPELTQARRVIWNGIDKDGKRYLDYIPKELIDGRPNNTEMKINLINGSFIQLAGADRYNALMGTNPVTIVFDEYSLQNPFAWHYLSPILAENGGVAKFIYTPRGMNHGYDLYANNINNPNWFVQKLDITQTFKHDGTPVTTVEVIDEERRAGMPEELIQQEYYCSFEAALVGAYYSKEIEAAYKENRVRDFEFLKGVPVNTGWDIGVRDSTAIWFFQVKDDDIYIINYYEHKGKFVDHYVEYVANFLNKHHLKPGIHFGPHDIENHHWESQYSPIEAAFKLGIRFRPVPRINKRIDGINTVRALFHKFVFHKTNCYHALNVLKQYQANPNSYVDEPLHDFSSHCADAMRTFACGFNDFFFSQNTLQPFTMRKWNL